MRAAFVLSVLLVGLFALSFISAQFSSSFVAKTPTSQFSDYGGSAFDSSMCREGQDFVLQISPKGCTPSVVRSDLLEKQNVPVFCPISAVQLNPLIDVEAIDGMTINGEVSGGSVGGFHPARAALGRGDLKVNSPVLGNIGYAVIVLRQNRNESSMPDFVEGNLTARISYDIKEHFGVGQATLYLPVMDDAEWNAGFNHYGFWEGLGYLRAESVGDERATISIYAGKADSSKIHGGKITSRTISVGQTSSDISLSGAAYCLAGLNIRLDGLEAADKTVRLNINGEFTEVKEGEKFLDNRCRIRKINSYGVIDEAVVSCDEDSKQSTFTLTFSPKVKLNISGVERDVGIGERLYVVEGSSVYLAYVGTRGDTLREEDLVIGLASVKGTNRNMLSDSELESFGDFFNSAPNGDIVGMISGINSVVDLSSVILKGIRTAAQMTKDWLQSGVVFDSIAVSDVKGKSVFGSEVIIVGFAEPVDADISVSKYSLRENYDNAVDDYQRVIDSYSSDKYPDDADSTLGQDALSGLIELNNGAGQKRVVAELCIEFEDAYPTATTPKICESAAKLASSTLDVQDVMIQGRVYRISLDRVKLPSFEEFGAEVSVKMPDGRIDSFDLRKEVSVVIDEKTGAYIQLLDVKDDISEQSIRIRTNIREGVLETAGRVLVGTDVEITIKKGFPSSRGGYLITLDDVNLVRVAKVSVLPEIRDSGTTAEFPVKIGIEKRLIQLSPEKTRDIVDKLNETIEKWSNINNKLGKVVEWGNVACLATGTGLTIKNFFLNLNGEGVARRLVMRGDGGWFDKCGENVASSRDVDVCLLENSDAIEKSVDEIAEVIRVQDAAIKELQDGITTSRFLEEDIVDTDKLVAGFVDDDYVSELRSSLSSMGSMDINGVNVPVSEILGRVSADAVYLTQARDLQMNSRLLSSSDSVVRAVAQKNVEKALVDIYVNTDESSIRQTFATKYGFAESGLISTGESVELPLTNVKTFGEVKGQFSGVAINDESYVYPVKDYLDGSEYLVVLDNSFVVEQTYFVSGSGVLSLVSETNKNPLKLRPKFYDAGAYNNRYENPKLKYYETGQYKGFPQIVPFDVNEGWYAGIKSTLPVLGGIQAYDDSGRVSSFYLCNVGENNKEEFFSGIGDDECVMINPGINAPYDNFPGLDSKKATRLTRTAINAIAKASQDYRAGVSGVRIVSPSGVERMIDVGESAVGTPDIQCQDFMSSTDCNLMFNVCDPVVCPSSRCDLGGTYPVRDVVASGVFGSIALCLPNWPEVKVPVCLSGVHAGVDAYLSVLENYQDCLENSLETGQQIGICDELHSIYMCDFFWRQSMPFANSVVPSALGKIFGKQGTRGGGEYLSVPSAWDGASDSAEFFTKQYAANSFEAFKVRSTTGVGTEVCKNWVSLRAPDGGSLLNSITKPRSPAQYYGRFTETPFTTATVPPTSHYKVFYHIYAGEDVPAYYQVYLKSTGQAFFQDTAGRRVVASGFVPQGEYATCGTNPAYPCDFTAPSGFSELCIVVNGNEECGFTQVTTDYGVNYLADKYVANEASRTDITSERVCVSGDVNLFSLNPTAGISDRLEPDLYNMGITRICATSNPDSATDPKADREGSRWVNVGYCDTPSVGCWLDTQSVSDTVKSTNIANEVVGDVSQDYLDVLINKGGYLSSSEFAKVVDDIGSQPDEYRKINLIGESIGKVFENNKKGFLTLLRGNAYKDLVVRAYQLVIGDEQPEPKVDGEPELFENGDEGDGEEGNIREIPSEQRRDYLTNKSLNEIEKAPVPVSEKNAEGTLSALSSPVPIKIKVIRYGLFDNFLGDLFRGDYTYDWDGSSWKLNDEPLTLIDDNSFELYKNGLKEIFEKTRVEYQEDRFSQLTLSCPSETVPPVVKAYPSENPSNIADSTSLGIAEFVITNSYSFGFTDVVKVIDDTIQENCALSQGNQGSSVISIGTCTTQEDCQKVLGGRIIEIARGMKSERISTVPALADYVVKRDTGLPNFECLVLAVAYQESKIQHCGSIGSGFQERGDPLYCDGNRDAVLKGDDGDSFGAMQVSESWHGATPEFEKNIRVGVSILIGGYNSDSMTFQQTQTLYSGWSRALRSYNGWGVGGDNKYVENVLSPESVGKLKELFPKVCS